MSNKRPKPEEIITKLRQVEGLTGQGMPRLDAIRQIGGEPCAPLVRAQWRASAAPAGRWGSTGPRSGDIREVVPMKSAWWPT